MSTLHLTFDDGPHPTWTPRVLRALAAQDARATFFVLGEQVRRHPDLVGAIREGGHTVGLHGDAHLDHRTASRDALARDSDRAMAALADVGVRPALWRLPWGRGGAATDEIARRLDLAVVGWDADTHDWRGDGWDDQPDAVKAAAEYGGVVLLHDGFGPGQTRGSAFNTIELVEAFAARAAASRVTVDDLTAPR